MKRLIILSIALLFSLSAFAQVKGDMYLAGNLGASCGTQTVTLSEGSYSTKTSQPLDASFGIGAEFGYFVANNMRLAFSLSLPVSFSPTSEDDGKWLKNTTVAVGINPNIAYYVRLAERFYYTPEFGVFFEFGSYKQKLSSSQSYRTGVWGWGVYLHYAAFEFRINEKFALGFNVGSLDYSSAKIMDQESDSSISTGQFKFYLNSASIDFRFYF